MALTPLERWEREFRDAAKADNCELLREHLNKLGLPDKPELLLEGTICIVKGCWCYSAIDNDREEHFDPFLEMQRYDPSNVEDARYAFTFDLSGKAYGRVLVETKVGTLDLADLYGHPWRDYQVVGYRQFWVSRSDGTSLTDEQRVELEDEITSDLRFDYSEDELDIDVRCDEPYLWIIVQDHYKEDE